MKKVILVGGGTSIRQGIDIGLWEKIKDKAEIWSLNYAFKAMPYLPVHQCWVDQSFFSNNQPDMQKLNEQGVTMSCKNAGVTYEFLKNKINLYTASRDSKQQSLENNTIFVGQSGFVGMFALSLAVLQRYEEIYLLGYDFGTVVPNDIDTHFYQGTKAFTYVSHGVGNTKIYNQRNGNIKPAVNDFGVYKDYKQIFNVSISSNIHCYPRVTYDAFFDMLEDKDVYKENDSTSDKNSN